MPTIAVIGGSFAGANVAKQLDAVVDASTSIVLIEQRDAFYHTVASVRTIVEKDLAPKVWIPYTSLFAKTAGRSKVVKAEAKELHEKHVILSNGDKIDFDYAVIATGASAPSPAKPISNEKDVHVKAVNELADGIKAADSILIVGGGAVGIEWAGEIADKYADKKITIVHNGPELLSSVAFAPPKLRKAILDRLARIPNVTVILNQKVLPAEGATSLLPSAQGWHIGGLTLKTSTGNEITSDVQLLATGISRPNSDLVTSLNPDLLTSDGYIKTRTTLQIESYDHIFALGDVSAVDKFKFSYLASEQAGIAAANILSLIANKSPTKKYVPDKAAVLAVTTGRKGGAALLFGWVVGDWVVKNVKGADLFLSKTYKDLGLTPPKN